MANISAFQAKAVLDWVLGGATPTRPDSRMAALTWGTPTSISAMGEIQTNSGYIRQSALFPAAVSNQGGGVAGSASNSASIVFGSFSSTQSILGLLLYDQTHINSGNIWWYGTLLTNRTVLPGDAVVVPTGGLIITLT